MSWFRGAVTVVSLGVVAGGIVVASCSTEPDYKREMKGEAQLERGEYLVTVLGCNDCHTPGAFLGSPDSTRLLSGSEMGWVGPWGVTFAPNITPDRETGIGEWDEQDIIRALTQGQRPDKSLILPPMPWPTYSHLTKTDLEALAVYLVTMPAVSHPNLKPLPPGSNPPPGSMQMVGPPPMWDVQHMPPPAAPAATSPKP